MLEVPLCTSIHKIISGCDRCADIKEVINFFLIIDNPFDCSRLTEFILSILPEINFVRESVCPSIELYTEFLGEQPIFSFFTVSDLIMPSIMRFGVFDICPSFVADISEKVNEFLISKDVGYVNHLSPNRKKIKFEDTHCSTYCLHSGEDDICGYFYSSCHECT